MKPEPMFETERRDGAPEPAESSPEAETHSLPDGSKIAGAAALRRAVWSAEALAERLAVDDEAVRVVTRRHRLRIPEHYLGLIGDLGDPIARQAIPSLEELAEDGLPEDPLAEDDPSYSPVPHLTHRYPDRVLLLVTDLCPMYCRFCMRKRKTLRGARITTEGIARGIDYVRRTPAVREVILSGGDPLMVPERLLARFLMELRAIPHVELLRVHTRMPCVEPGRITQALAQLLGRARPLWMAVHFNHPREVTPEAAAALRLLARAGIPLNNQAVLLRGVNDDPALLAELYRRLMRCGVHPYYLHHGDQVQGTEAFRLSVREGMAIVARLREIAPELAMLHYVLDTPGGGGKVPLG
jgi:lysine 2,3-aminomutase